jgi:hypothetical protein
MLGILAANYVDVFALPPDSFTSITHLFDRTANLYPLSVTSSELLLSICGYPTFIPRTNCWCFQGISTCDTVARAGVEDRTDRGIEERLVKGLNRAPTRCWHWENTTRRNGAKRICGIMIGVNVHGWCDA